MSEPNSADDTLAAAERLEGAMRTLASEVGQLRTYGEHNRRMIWGLIASLVISIAGGIVAVRTSIIASQNRQNAVVTCQSGNEARSVSRQLWTYLLDQEETSPSLTPAERQQLLQFRGYIRTIYADRDCSNASEPTVVPPGTQPPTK